MLQRVLAIHIRESLTVPRSVEDLIVGTGRPLGLFPTADKRHTTAWQVTVDTVRGAVVRQPIAGAVANVMTLINDTLELPAAGLADTLSVLTKARFDAAKSEAQAVVALGTVDLPTLRRAVRAFLTLRNITPLSAVDTGPYSPGSGESAPASRLRAADADPIGDPGALRDDIWALLDFDALKTMLAPATGGNQLGAEATPNAVTKITWAAAAAAQHLASMRLAYPTAFAYATHNTDLKADFLTRAVAKGLGAVQATSVADALVPGLAWRPRPVAHRTADPEGDQDFSVQIMSDQGRVTQLVASGRPATVLSTGQGSHLIAFVLHVEVLRTLATGPLRHAIRDVRASLEHIINDNEQHGSLKRALPSGSVGRYAAARKVATDAIARSHEIALDRQSRLEDICIAWLTYVNALPLSAVKEGLALNKGEGTTTANLRIMEADRSGAPSDSSWLTAWGLLDRDALRNIVTRDGRAPLRLRDDDAEVQDYPGATRKPAADGAYIVCEYLEKMRVAFPNVVADTRLDGVGSLAYLLRTLMGLTSDVIGVIAMAVNFEFDDMYEALRAAPVAPSRKRGRAGNDDDDEYQDSPPKQRHKAAPVAPTRKRRRARTDVKNRDSRKRQRK